MLTARSGKCGEKRAKNGGKKQWKAGKSRGKAGEKPENGQQANADRLAIPVNLMAF